MCSGSAALMCSDPGASGDQSPAPPRTSHRRGVHPTGNACPQGTEPKDRGCMIGAISNWPISMPATSTTQMTVCGHEDCCYVLESQMVTPPSPPPVSQQYL